MREKRTEILNEQRRGIFLHILYTMTSVWLITTLVPIGSRMFWMILQESEYVVTDECCAVLVRKWNVGVIGRHPSYIFPSMEYKICLLHQLEKSGRDKTSSVRIFNQSYRVRFCIAPQLNWKRRIFVWWYRQYLLFPMLGRFGREVCFLNVECLM